MLEQLLIKNFVLVSQAELTLTAGLTILTGETGAGKSLLLDALGAVLGDKAQSFWVRPNADKAEVSASFQIQQLANAKAWLLDHELTSEEEDHCLIRRVIHADGKTKAYINGSAVTLTQLRQLAEMLVELHSQHEHHALLKSAQQLALLDNWAQLGDQVKQVKQAYKQWHQAVEDKQTLLARVAQQAEKQALLRFQLQELVPFNFVEGEYEQISQEHHRLAHAQEIGHALTQAQSLLNDADDSAISQLNHLLYHLAKIERFDAHISELMKQGQSALAELSDLYQGLRHLARGSVSDDQRLAEMDHRLQTYHQMAKKYLLAPESLWQKVEQLQADQEDLEQSDQRLEEMDARIAQCLQAYQQVASQLSLARQTASPKLSAEVIAELEQLGMPHSQLQWQLTPQSAPQPFGNESADILFSANVGQGLHPMVKVASGGELSRISLAIEVCVATQISLPVLVFDEIDVGVGGGVASAIGQKLSRLAQSKQVLCITHQAQVAAYGDQHWHIAKSVIDEQTQTQITVLDDVGRVNELARMIGTGKQDDTTQRHAQQMIQQAREEKGR